MAVYTLEHEKARKAALGIPLNHGKATPPAATPQPKTTGVVPPYIPPKPVNTPAPVAASTVTNQNNGVAMPPAASTATKATQTPSGGYIPNAATSQGTPAPALGYGAGGVYGQDKGVGAAYAANTALISTDAGKQGETTRTLSTIDEINKALAADPNNADLKERLRLANKYLTNQLGYVPPSNNEVQAQGIPAETPQVGYPMLTKDQITADVQYQDAADRANLVTATELQTGNLKNNAEFATKLINDSRVINDFSEGQSVNPFANMGKRTWDQGLKSRQRDIDDTYRGANLTNEINAVQKDLYNFDKLAPERQRALINEAVRIEREYGLQIGSLTGQIPGMGKEGQTLDSKQFDWSKDPNNPQNQGQQLSNDAQRIANQISQLNLDNLPQEIKLGLQQLEQSVKKGDIDIQTAEWQLKELSDPNSATNKAKALELEMMKLEAAGMPEKQRLEIMQLRKSIAQIGKVQPKSQYEIDMQGINLDKARIELNKLQNPSGNVPYQENPEFANDIQWIINNPTSALSSLQGNAKKFIDEYGYPGYQELLKAATPKDDDY